MQRACARPALGRRQCRRLISLLLAEQRPVVRPEPAPPHDKTISAQDRRYAKRQLDPFEAMGQGAEVRSPMAITVMGGLLVSTLLTLFVIPVAYRLMESRRQ